jgi:uncharacterized membrane protein YjfL (UPF0719 family)
MASQKSIIRVITWGTLSVMTYVALYLYADVTVSFAERVHNGEKMLAIVPIVIAFVFSIVHGNFTAHFWDHLGFQAKKK